MREKDLIPNPWGLFARSANRIIIKVVPLGAMMLYSAMYSRPSVKRFAQVASCAAARTHFVS